MIVGPTRPCRYCGSVGCDHTPLMRLYGIRSLAVDEMDEHRDGVRQRSEEASEEALRRKERE